MITGSSSETVEIPVQPFIRISPYVIFLGLPRGGGGVSFLACRFIGPHHPDPGCVGFDFGYIFGGFRGGGGNVICGLPVHLDPRLETQLCGVWKATFVTKTEGDLKEIIWRAVLKILLDKNFIKSYETSSAGGKHT